MRICDGDMQTWHFEDIVWTGSDECPLCVAKRKIALLEARLAEAERDREEEPTRD